MLLGGRQGARRQAVTGRETGVTARTWGDVAGGGDTGTTDVPHLHTQLLACTNVLCGLFSQRVPAARWQSHLDAFPLSCAADVRFKLTVA